MSNSAGCRTFELSDVPMNLTFPVLVLYPSHSPEETAQLGPYSATLAMDGQIAPGAFPLVVISHGTGGSHLVYRDLAEHLARNGYVVAIPEHPRNNRNNNDLANTAINLENRPRHIRTVIDWALATSPFATNLTSNAVALIGHSLGGYTMLALAGGVPTAYPQETADRQFAPIAVTPDARVKALVLFAPAAMWYMAHDALQNVRVPILMYTAEKDEHTAPVHAQVISRGIPDKTLLEHHSVANAGHYAFLTPFPEALVSPDFAPSQDPAGFDRAQFHKQMNAEVLAFLNRTI